MKTKAASLHWDFMFACAMHQTPDMIEQHNLLSFMVEKIDPGRNRTTVSDVLNMRQAHELFGCGKAQGKIVLEGF